MDIKLIKFNDNIIIPTSMYSNDAGLDIYMPEDGIIKHGVNKIPLGIGFCLPAGYCGFVYTRSSLTKRGLIPMLAPIDSSYTGEIHFLVYNTEEDMQYKQHERLCQFVVHLISHITPVVMNSQRGKHGFGSSGN